MNATINLLLAAIFVSSYQPLAASLPCRDTQPPEDKFAYIIEAYGSVPLYLSADLNLGYRAGTGLCRYSFYGVHVEPGLGGVKTGLVYIPFFDSNNFFYTKIKVSHMALWLDYPGRSAYDYAGIEFDTSFFFSMRVYLGLYQSISNKEFDPLVTFGIGGPISLTE